MTNVLLKIAAAVSEPNTGTQQVAKNTTQMPGTMASRTAASTPRSTASTVKPTTPAPNANATATPNAIAQPATGTATLTASTPTPKPVATPQANPQANKNWLDRVKATSDDQSYQMAVQANDQINAFKKNVSEMPEDYRIDISGIDSLNLYDIWNKLDPNKRRAAIDLMTGMNKEISDFNHSGLLGRAIAGAKLSWKKDNYIKQLADMGITL